VGKLGVDLMAYEPGSRTRQAVEEAVPAICGHDDDVVGREARRRRGRRPHSSEQLLRGGEIDHAVDSQPHGLQGSAIDGDGVADGHTEVRGHLLGDQDAAGRTDELP
jgi:hypothetical protein